MVLFGFLFHHMGHVMNASLSDIDWQIIKARKACGGLTRDEMLLGSTHYALHQHQQVRIQCQEAVKLLHGLEVLESRGYI